MIDDQKVYEHETWQIKSSKYENKQAKVDNIKEFWFMFYDAHMERKNTDPIIPHTHFKEVFKLICSQVHQTMKGTLVLTGTQFPTHH